MRIIFILQNTEQATARGSRRNSGCGLIPRLPGGLAAVLLGKGHVLVPRPAAGRSNTEGRARELSDGEDSERLEQLGLLPSANPLGKRNSKSQQGRVWHGLSPAAGGVHCTPPHTHCGSAALSHVHPWDKGSSRIIVQQECQHLRHKFSKLAFF